MSSLIRFFQALVLALTLTAAVAVSDGCAGSTTTIGATSTVSASPGDVAWTAGVNVTISIARAAIPAAKSVFDASPNVRPDARTIGDQVFQTAIDSLPLLQTALDTYTHAPTAENRCRIHFYIAQIITATLQGATIARDAGAQIPPLLPIAVAGLATVADAIFPDCGTSSSAPPTARRTPYQETVRAAFAPRSAQ